MTNAEINYKALSDLAGEDIGEWASRAGRTKLFKATGFMDLHLESLSQRTVSLTHYFEQNGDLVPDPDMEIRIDPVAKTALALHFQDQRSYSEVYPDGVEDPRQFKSQNSFLTFWLNNIRSQRFKQVEEKKGEVNEN
jgi:uncharacterized protein YqiB (DUF1249 family)